MTSVTSDRRQGLNSSAAIKVPCIAATTGNIALSGLQTVDGVILAPGDRVLVKNQIAQEQNGIYAVDTGNWTRDLDFDGAYDAVTGTLTTVLSGTVNANTYWRVTTANPITIGSSNMAFTAAMTGDSALLAFLQAGAGAVARTAQAKMRDFLVPQDFGAKADGATDDLAALQLCDTEAVAIGASIYLPPGIYKITAKWSPVSAIFGASPDTSIIYNTGVGDALDLSKAGYYQLYSNFQVKGNVASRDGISMFDGAGNLAYSHFHNVYATYNGRHGFYHRQAWGTRYSMCKAHYNGQGVSGGCGYYVDFEPGDAGGANAVNWLECDARWNGAGLGAAATYNDDSGGIKVKGTTAGLHWIGGVIESNHPWGVNIQSPASAMRSITFEKLYAELNGVDATQGGFMAIFSNILSVALRDSWIAVSATAGKTNYGVFNNNGVTFYEENCFITTTASGGTEIARNGISSTRPFLKYSPVVGDLASAGVPTTKTLFTVSADGRWTVKGQIHCRRDSDNTGGIYPFIVSLDPNVVGIKTAIGASIVSAATTAPTLAVNGAGPYTIDLTFAANHFGHVELDDAGIYTTPITLEYDASMFVMFDGDQWRRK